MTTLVENTACPVCYCDRAIPVSRVATAPIATYWSEMGYDLRAAFPELPDYLAKNRCPRCDVGFFLPRIIGGADLYAALQRTNIYYGASKWEFTEVLRLLANIGETETLLEFGCGRGVFLEHVKPHFKKAMGIDFNEEAIAECRKKGLDARLLDLSEINETYDIVVTFQVMEHLATPGKAIAQLVDMVRPGGQLIIAVPNEDGPLGELEDNYLNLPPHHFTRWTRRTMDFVAEAHGLHLEKYICEPLSEMLYLTLANERFNRHLSATGLSARIVRSIARRILVAGALAQFDAVRDRLVGHTQIAAYRKPTPASA